MTKTNTKMIYGTAIVAIGAILILGAINFDAEAKTFTSKIKVQGNGMFAFASVPGFAVVNAFQLASGDVGLSYNSSAGSGFCVIDDKDLKGSGTNEVSLSVDTTLFTLVPSATNPGECTNFSTLGLVSATVKGDGLITQSFNGVQTFCFTSVGVEFCSKFNGNSSSESGTIVSGSVLGIDMTLLTNQNANINKQNSHFSSWTNP